MASHDSITAQQGELEANLAPAGSEPPPGTDTLRRPDWLQAESQAREEAAHYRRQWEVLREARERLDPIWSAHPDWTFEQVCTQYLAEHPEGFGEGSA